MALLVGCDAVFFDLDGVLVDITDLRQQAWAALFKHAIDALTDDSATVTAYTADDYVRLVRGRPKAQAVQAFLASRRLPIPIGSPDDSDAAPTVHGLARLQDLTFRRMLNQRHPRPQHGAKELLQWLDLHGIAKAVVSRSRNADAILRAVGLRHHVDVLVDGIAANLLGFPDFQRSDAYQCATRQLDTQPRQTTIVTATIDGAQIGSERSYRIVGVDPGHGCAEFSTHCDIVVREIGELLTATYETTSRSG